MFSLVLIFPLFSSIALFLTGSLIGTFGSLLISCTNLLLAFSFSILSFWNVSFDFMLFTNLWTWVSLSSFPVEFSLRYDSLTAVMFIVVTTVSLLVHIYSSVYMFTDPFLSRFMAYLSLFSFFMLVLVSSGNILVLFLGWEGVGLCSYLLIGFWHTRIQAGKAATKAFLINKIGDLFLLSGISLIFMAFHSLDFSVISLLSPFCPPDTIELIAMFLFIGAVGKSAQIGLHTWLPDAMEGPTPVSALIHAATMVTAGVFLVIRCSPMLEFAPRVLYIIAVWGGITALISGTIGAVQSDIKKIIAYSTCSQLGYMILSCGLSMYNISFFHLFNHAFFKALLFLSAGSVIHIMSNEQDIRKMGGLGALTPFIYVNVLIGSLALSGFPFLAGFYSKDLIIEASNTRYWTSGQFLYWLSAVAAILTMFYSARLLYLVFVGSFSGFKITIANRSKVTGIEMFILGLLGLLSISTGYLFRDAFTGVGSDYFSNFTVTLPSSWSFINLEFIPTEVKLAPLATSIIALFVAVKLSHRTTLFLSSSKTVFESCKWFYNEVLNSYIALPLLISGRHFFEQYEKRGLELNGPIMLSSLLSNPQYVSTK